MRKAWKKKDGSIGVEWGTGWKASQAVIAVGDMVTLYGEPRRVATIEAVAMRCRKRADRPGLQRRWVATITLEG